VAEAARLHDLAPEVPIVALGGAGGVLAPHVAARLRRPLVLPAHAPVLSAIGAALSLVQAEVVRPADRSDGAAGLVREAERACVTAGAAPLTVTVHTTFEADAQRLRATATGAAALESGAATRDPIDEPGQRAAAAAATGTADPAALQLVARTPFYRVFTDDGTSRVAVVDEVGAVPVCAEARAIVVGDDDDDLMVHLRRAVDARTTQLGLAALLPRVCVVSGAHVVDLSDSRRAEDILRDACAALGDDDGSAVAVIFR
jgi:hypothetical protein